MSARSTAQLNVPLTTYAKGIAADSLAAYSLANLICPIVQVGSTTGTYKIHNDKNSFLVEDSQRALGGARKRLQFEKSDGTFNCKPHGLEIGDDDFESEMQGSTVLAGADEQDKIKSMVSRKSLGYAQRVMTKVGASLTPVADRGNWTNPEVDPIDQLDEQLETLSLDVSNTQNISVIMSVSVWRKVRANAKVKARLGIKGDLSLSEERLVQGLLFPVKLIVSAVTLTTKKFGQADVASGEKTSVLGSYCLLNYGIPSPSRMDATAFKCFSTSSVLVDSVKTYREEQANSDIHAMDWSEDIQLTSTLSARLLSIT